MARAHTLGFDPPNDPPKWVWWEIVRILEEEVKTGRSQSVHH